MKYTKIFYGNQFVTKFYVGHLTKWQRFCRKFEKYAKRTIVVGGIFTAIGWAYVGGIMTKMTTADTKIIYMQSTSTPAMLLKICKAESGLRQFDSNGNVLRGKVNPSDIGYCQINEPIWNDKARKLGYDIYTEQGNKDMALWIYNNYGDSPWDSSKSTWNK